MKSSESQNPQRGFCIYIDTLCQGRVPVERNERNFPVVYPMLMEAQREITEFTIDRLKQFLAGERDFDDAITVEEYVVEVDVFSDGSILDENGGWFGKLG